MNNADSFAIAFDEAWQKNIAPLKEEKLEEKEKIDLALSYVKAHPFLKNQPSKAREVAEFRIRLLKLK